MKSVATLLKPCSWLLFILFFANHQQLRAQNLQEISGIVLDSASQVPLPGVSVLLKGAENGTSTDLEGRYSIRAASNDVLVFSFLGYESLEVPVRGKTEINVSLKQSLSELDQVVVIGYGTQKKKDLTGAVSQISAERLENENPNAVQDILRGNIAGLNVGFSTSAKGGGDLQVRGKNTLNAGSSPLIVLDGIIYYGSLSDINPNDIETIDVLKDASSAAVYGAKAANGVILVTTKKGRTEKTIINFNTNFGIADMSVNEPVYGAREFISWREDVMKSMDANHRPYEYSDPRTLPTDISQEEWLSYDNSGGDPVRVWLQRLNFQPVEISNYMQGKSIDWYDKVFQSGIRQDHTLSLSGKKDELSYYWSVGYLENEGIIVGDKYSTVRSRLNLESKVASFLTVGLNTQIAGRDESQVLASWSRMTQVSPWGSEFDDEGKLRLSPQDDPPVARNPLLAPAFTDRMRKYTNLISSLYAKVSLPFGITYQVNFSPRVEWYKYFNHESAESPEWELDGGNVSRQTRQIYNWQLDNLIKWNRTFNDVHQFDVTLLVNAEKYQSWDQTLENNGFDPNDELGYHNVEAGINPLLSANDEVHTADALMARLFYSFKDRYLLTMSVRRDGYSAFGQENPRATFPAAAFGWVFTEEPFFNAEWLNYGKLRFSYGVNGNRDIGRYAALSDLSSGKYLHVTPDGVEEVSRLWVSKLSNYNLKWEQTAAWNLGLDFSLFNNMLEGNIEAYTMSTTDLLVERSLPDVIGFEYVWDNLGEVQNKGIELNLSSWNMNKKNFSWRTTVNFSLNRNKIISLYGDMTNVLDDNGNVIGQREVDDIANEWFIGHSIDAVWDIPVQGVYQLGEEEEAGRYGLRPGDFKLKDGNNDGNFSDADREFLGYGEPRFRWTLRNEFRLYKNIDFSFMLYSYWGHMASFNTAKNSSGYLNRNNSYVFPYWTPDNPLNDYARLNSSSGSANYNVYKKRSFIRLDNIALGYSFNTAILEKLKVKSLKAFFTIRNVAIWAPDWIYWDPDWDPDEGPGPTPRTFTLGLDLTL